MPVDDTHPGIGRRRLLAGTAGAVAGTAAGIGSGALPALATGRTASAPPRPGPTGRADLVVADFETAGWDGWEVTGTAFGDGPAIGFETIRPLAMDGWRGEGVASSEWQGDGPQGTVTSPPFRVRRHYIAYAVSGGDYEFNTCAELLVDGEVVRQATGRRSDTFTSGSWDVRDLDGKEARLRLVDTYDGDWGHVNADHFVQTDDPPTLPANQAPLYREHYRPLVHFTARQWTMNRLNPQGPGNPDPRQEGWLNDLNGLTYYDGEWHLFAQRWNQCWIHAVSRDLVHWTELPPAFFEERLYSGVQSGSIVVDVENTSGLGTPGAPAMVAFWSRRDNASQCLSYSTDHGRTWTHSADNPLFVAPERDPKVLRYVPGEHWVMFLYGNGRYRTLTSTDLLHWEETGWSIDGYECPDFFELPVDGDDDHRKWVLVDADGRYLVGDFDGERFTPDSDTLQPTDSGPNFYATQTFGNTAEVGGRVVQLAWMRGGVYPDMPFNQQVTFPRELTLTDTADGLRLRRSPVREIEELVTKRRRVRADTLTAGSSVTLDRDATALLVRAEVRLDPGTTLVLATHGIRAELTGTRVTNGTGADLSSPLTSFEAVVDRTSLEVFANDGEVSVSRCFVPDDTRPASTLTARGGRARVTSLEVSTLGSLWT